MRWRGEGGGLPDHDRDPGNGSSAPGMVGKP